MDLLRRLAISDKEDYRQMVTRSGSSRLRSMIVGDLDWITPWAQLMADEENVIIPELRLSALFGDRAAEVIDTLDQELQEPPWEDDTAIAAIDDYVLRAISGIGLNCAIDALLKAYDIPTSLPMVDQVIDCLHAEPDLFDDTVVVASQHILGSNVALLNQFTHMGVDPHNVYVLGKVYSTSRPAMLILERLGMSVCRQSVTLPASVARFPQRYEYGRAQAAAKILEEAVRKTRSFKAGGTLLVLDDGGTAIRMVMKLLRREPWHTVIAVEQTMSGIHRIRKGRVSPSFPIVNVADSYVKHHRESPLIATSVRRELLIRLQKITGESSLSGSDVLILGFGPIGVQVANEMRDFDAKSIAVYDINPSRIPSIGTAGFVPLYQLNSNLRQFNVIVGCTGERSLPNSLLNELRSGTVLASASSSNIEFNGLISRRKDSFKWPWSSNLGIKSDFQLAHADYILDSPNGNLWMLNSGFPVNFTGGVDPIPSQLIQMTRALMLGAAIQAKRLTSKPPVAGWVKLDMAVQRLVDENLDKYEQKFSGWLGPSTVESSH